MSKLKFIFIGVCLIVICNSQQATCLGTGAQAAQDESEVREKLESLSKRIDWIDLKKLRDVLMDLVRSIRDDWKVHKNLIADGDKAKEFKNVVRKQLRNFMKDMELREQIRKEAQQLLFAGSTPDLEGQLAKSFGYQAQKLLATIENARRDHAQFTDTKGKVRPFHEGYFMSSDSDGTKKKLGADLQDPSEAKMSNLVDKSLQVYPDFVNEKTSSLKEEKLRSISKKTEEFMDKMFAEELRELALMMVKEVVASRKIDVNSQAFKLIFDKVLKNLVVYLCDILIDLLAIILNYDFVPQSAKQDATAVSMA